MNLNKQLTSTEIISVIIFVLFATLVWIGFGCPHPLRFVLSKQDYAAFIFRQMGTIDELNTEARQIFNKYESMPVSQVFLHKSEPLCQRLCSRGRSVVYSEVRISDHKGSEPLYRIAIDYDSKWASESIIIYDPDWPGQLPTHEFGRPLTKIEENIFINPVPERPWT